MALRPDRDPTACDISFFMDTTGDAGIIVCGSTGGSGVALDSSVAVVTAHATGSGQTPIGMLMHDVVNKDLTKTYLNYYTPESQVGDKVAVMTRGWAVTNKILGTPSALGPAYLGASGLISATRSNIGWPAVGVFLSSKDADGYAKVSINLPANTVTNA